MIAPADSSLCKEVLLSIEFLLPTASIGIYTYYVTETLNGCEGPSIPVTLEIYNIPSSPIVANQTVCFGSNIPALTAVGRSEERR